jgi:hypothetical protein
MKKFILLGLISLIYTQLNCWKSFIINNDLQNTIKINDKKTSSGQSKTIFNKNKLSNNQTIPNSVIAVSNDQIDIAETKPTDIKRTFLIRPVIIINKNAEQRIIKASDIFNQKLPKDFSFKEYATGLKIPKKEDTKDLGISPMAPNISVDPIETRKNPLIYIENDTNFPTSLISVNKQKTLEIKPIRKSKKNNQLKQGEKFTINSVLYQNYKPEDGMTGLTRYKFVDENNILSINVRTPNETHKFELKILPECKNGTILKISGLIHNGFEIVSHEKTNIKLR